MPRVLLLEASLLLLAVLTLTTWFGLWPRGLSPGLCLAVLVAGVLWRLGMRERSRPGIPRPSPEMAIPLVLAALYRLPALLHPWGIVNKDGAYGAFIALHLLQGARPAPVFTEGANYQGTLKSHLAALLGLVTGSRDFSWLMTMASFLLLLVIVGATVALTRRVAGRGPALLAGSYLALGPRFFTLFTLNCVGQYADVLAVGGVALALLARMIDQAERGFTARGAYLALGALLGVGFWQQPVVISYAVVVAAVLLLRRETWSDPWVLAVPLGAAVGVLPVVVWNLQNAWASSIVVTRDPSDIQGQIEALPYLAQRTFSISFPILAGLGSDLPWSRWAAVSAAAALLFPLAFAVYLFAVRGDLEAGGSRRLVVLMAPLLLLVCLAVFWATASGRIAFRPRYLLPAVSASAIHLGVALHLLWRRWPWAGALVLAGILALNGAGTLPRLATASRLAGYYEGVVRSLEEKGIRTGYADFSLSAPVTMFTAERIILSSRLGPTPAFESDQHTQAAASGPDAYVLTPDDDVAGFEARLTELGVACRFEREPVPVFFACSRPVALGEVAGFRAASAPADAGD